jgi:signal transduction histidine kinase
MTGLRQVSTDIAHDLRTPLTRLRQRLELAYRGDTDAAALRAAVGNSIRDVDTILETFGALLRIAEIEARARTAGFTTFDLATLLRTIIDDYQPVAEEQERTITSVIGERLLVHADWQLLTQMLANLLENALRHTPHGAAIDVMGFRDGKAVVVEIADRGAGIPPDQRDKVFEPLYRLEASRNTPGSGMGLSIVAAIARQHRIQVRLLDNLPGLRVRLQFPEDAVLASDTPGRTPMV